MKITITAPLLREPTYQELEQKIERLRAENDRLENVNTALFDLLRPLLDCAEMDGLERLDWLKPITKTIQ